MKTIKSFLQALECVLCSGVVGISEALAMRKVCNKWKAAVDKYSSKPHFGNNCKPWLNIPHVSIKLLLEDHEFWQLQELAACDQNVFIGGRLKIEYQGEYGNCEDGRNNALVHVLEATAHVWQHVKHLYVDCTLLDFEQVEFSEPDGGLGAVFGPWLSRMTNVVTFRCESDFAVELLNCLPNPDKLESIKAGYADVFRPERAARYDWPRLLQQCCANIKRIEIVEIDDSLHRAMSVESLSFPNLEVFGAKTDVSEKAFNLITSCVTLDRFPKLKKIMIPIRCRGCFIGKWEDCLDETDSCKSSHRCEEKKPKFMSQLVKLTNTMSSLEIIQIYACHVFEPLAICPNIDFDLYGRGSRTVKKLLVDYLDFGVEFEIVLQWSSIVGNLFPCLGSLQVNGQEMVKSVENGEWTRKIVGCLQSCKNEECDDN